ncbi:MAG: phage portal protein [Candidatus Paracaedibacteraceae bacterium]|nr:phage portal protein [Candidatus Paracaedibacteraceae bacterium]
MKRFKDLWKKGLPSGRSPFNSDANVFAETLISGSTYAPSNRFDRLVNEGYRQNVIAYRCITVISRALSSVPWLLYKRDRHGEHELESHPLLTLLNSPSPRQAGSSFMEEVVSYLLLSGNSYIEAILGGDGAPVALFPVRPDRVRIMPGKRGVPNSYHVRINETVRDFTVDPMSGQSRILHIKLFHPMNDWYGLSPMEAASKSIDQHNAVGGHNLALLNNGGRPSGALMIKPNENGLGLSEGQRSSLRKDLKRAYEGSDNAGRVMVLEGDFEWREMGLTPKDLDFVEGKNMSAREICQAFGVAPMLAGVPGDATFANYREARFHLWEDTILPLLELLVAEFNLWLQPYYKENFRLGYDLDGIQALAPKREAAWQKIAAADFLTINEKRQAVGYGPIDMDSSNLNSK